MASSAHAAHSSSWLFVPGLSMRRASSPSANQGTHSASFSPLAHSKNVLIISLPKTLRFRSPKIQVSLENGGGKIVQGSTMDEIYSKLAHRLFSAAITTTPSSNSKYIVGLAGPPGAGKSTVAKEVTDRVNTLWHKQQQTKYSEDNELDAIAISLPMDGFHLYRWQLDAMEDPAEAHSRRGAPWTFDPDSLIRCLLRLRREGLVYAPSFDHGIGDPKENDIFVSPSHRVVIVEGNYLLLEDDSWKDLSNIFDECWFLDVDISIAMKRVEERFIKLGKNPGEVKARVQYNDQKNAELIFTSRPRADLVIKSVEIES